MVRRFYTILREEYGKRRTKCMLLCYEQSFIYLLKIGFTHYQSFCLEVLHEGQSILLFKHFVSKAKSGSINLKVSELGLIDHDSNLHHTHISFAFLINIYILMISKSANNINCSNLKLMTTKRGFGF